MKKIYKKICAVFIMPFMLAHYAVCAADYVIPSGRTVGIKIYADGMIVAGTAYFTCENGESVCPARDAGIRAGDVIKSVNGREVLSCEDFTALENGDEIECTIRRGGGEFTARVTPARSERGEYLTGMWARDSAAGIGTLTFINPENMRYTALGHAVTDIDTGNVMEIREGSVNRCEIISVNPGHIGFPGSVSADFTAEPLGSIDNNGENGISGAYGAVVPETGAVETADARDGDAVILTDVCGGAVMEYAVRLSVVSRAGLRNMVIEVTDPELLKVTGGIVQGMSGAPVMQDGKLVGAVTHVFVNDPKKGYAVSAANLAE